MRLKRILMIVAASFFVLFLLLFIFKSSLFQYVLQKEITEFNSKNNWQLAVANAEVSGLNSVSIHGLKVGSPTQDSLLFLDDIKVKVSVLRLLTGNRSIQYLELSNGFLKLDRTETNDKDSSVITEDKKHDKGISPQKALNRISNLLPSNFSLRNLSLYYVDSLGRVNIKVDSFLNTHEDLQGTIRLSDDTLSQSWQLSGQFGENSQITAFPLQTGALPGLKERLGLDFRADTLQWAYQSNKENKLAWAGNISAKIVNLRIHQAKLSTDTIGFSLLQTDSRFSLYPTHIEVDTLSAFQINQVQGHYGLYFPFTETDKRYALFIQTKEQAAQDFFESLPKGAFDDVRGIKVKGDLKYELRFVMDGNNPHDLVFESGLSKKNFGIQQYGARSLSFMNGDFVHTVYEYDRPFREVVVGSSNPRYTPIQEVPERLIKAILVSEDPSFYVHQGFIMEAFKEAIAENYEAGRFKRGGSTISMQLIKNLFLNRKKTVFRKIEEALLVWLIEGQRLSSKERMMEVYLNIIEWGPGIYGIGEASEFYFKKKPSQLSLQECIYLANIIPRPKTFKYGFEKDGSLRPHMRDLQMFILRRMVVKEFITPLDTAGYIPSVELRGDARNWVVTVDSNTVDSTEFLDEEF